MTEVDRVAPDYKQRAKELAKRCDSWVLETNGGALALAAGVCRNCGQPLHMHRPEVQP